MSLYLSFDLRRFCSPFVGMFLIIVGLVEVNCCPILKTLRFQSSGILSVSEYHECITLRFIR